ncbi:MAG: hypothetical protein AB1798_23055 [Spirochaetota bacterium]
MEDFEGQVEEQTTLETNVTGLFSEPAPPPAEKETLADRWNKWVEIIDR